MEPDKSQSVWIGKLCDAEWDTVLSGFDDASIYQTYAYGARRWGPSRLEHLLVRRDGHVRAAAQVTLMSLPVLGVGVAYVPWGPLWRPSGLESDRKDFSCLLGALRKEYVVRRGLLVRVAPTEVANTASPVESSLQELGWQRSAKKAHRTIIIDLRRPPDVIRKEMSAKWRENLRRAERGAFHLEEGETDALLSRFRHLYTRMWDRKRFAESVRVGDFKAMQSSLPPKFKLGVMISQLEGRDSGGLVWSAAGRTGIPLFSAVVDEGLKQRAAYLLRWHLLLRLQERGCWWLDQGGVSETANPGGFVFKSGMGGEVVEYVGQYEVADAFWSRCAVRTLETAKSKVAALKNRLKKRLSPGPKVDKPT